ncbi:MAG: DMT family protein, partial [Bdellovibrionia bacterium]
MSFNSFPVLFRTVALLFLSNCFMTVAWYGHLRFKSASLW